MRCTPALPDTPPTTCGCGTVSLTDAAPGCADSLERRRARKSEQKRRLLLYNRGLCRDTTEIVVGPRGSINFLDPRAQETELAA